MAPKMGAMLKKAVGHNEKGGKGKLLGFHNTEELMSAIHVRAATAPPLPQLPDIASLAVSHSPHRLNS
jgi:hypothetical protein